MPVRGFDNRGLALAICVFLVLITMPASADRDSTDLVGQLTLCVLGGLTILRPLIAGTLAGITVTVMFSFNADYLGLSVTALAIVIAVTMIQGLRLPALVFAVWYASVSIAGSTRNANDIVDMAQGAIFWLVFMFAPLLLGDIIRRIQLRAELQRRDHALATEHERRAIARDLHDTLAYATTTMVMKAEQARLRGGHDPHTRSDLDFIATTGRSAAADLRTMVALLRQSHAMGDGTAEMPGMLPSNPLEEVIDAQRAKLGAFDFETNLALSGSPSELPERASTVLARVLTEVASNITKHGNPEHAVSLMIDLEGPEVEAVFVNSAKDGVAKWGQRGMGLVGLQEIVTGAGGNLESGPVNDRWITHVTLPRLARPGTRTGRGGRGE